MARWSTTDPDFGGEQSTKTVREDILRLMSVVDASTWSGTHPDEGSITDLLKTFVVGTERGKPPPPPPNHNEKYKPLRDYKAVNPSHKATLKALKKEQKPLKTAS